MSKELKTLGIVLLGLFIWSSFSYTSMAFLEAEINPFVWSKSSRGVVVFLTLCYVVFIPAIVSNIYD